LFALERYRDEALRGLRNPARIRIGKRGSRSQIVALA
jgi:hypothetical protein